MSAKVISFINYKGGVGKTTTTYHVGCALAYYHSKRVLLVDIDPQTNLTFLCVDYESWKNFKIKNGTIFTLYEKFLRKESFQTSRCIWQEPVGRNQFTKIRGLALLPCDIDLLGEDLGGVSQMITGVAVSGNPFQRLQKHAKTILREWLFLQQTLSQVKNNYDYILIDCPPNIYLMTQNALVASDWYIVTTIPEYLSIIGLQILIRKVNEINNRINRIANIAGNGNINVAKLGGIIFVKVRIGGAMITNQHVTQMEYAKKNFKECFESYTTELIGYSEAAEQKLPVWLSDTPNASRAAKKKEYEKITEEFLRRFSA